MRLKAMKIIRDNDSDGAKIAFVFLMLALTYVTSIIMYFVILIKGWGMSVQSWAWMISIWICMVIVNGFKDSIVKFIKEDL